MSTNSFHSSAAADRRLRVALDLTAVDVDVAALREWLDPTAHHPSGASVRITADDLRAAQRQTANIHAAVDRSARLPAAVDVLVDLEAMTAEQPGTARLLMGRHDTARRALHQPESLRYVGTPAGLTGLIADIYAAGVADGVTLRPLSIATLRDFCTTAPAILRRFGLLIETMPLLHHAHTA